MKYHTQYHKYYERVRNKTIIGLKLPLNVIRLLGVLVRNKTIIGLKYLPYHTYLPYHVRNKTIIGLKFGSRVWKYWWRMLEIRL